MVAGRSHGRTGWRWIGGDLVNFAIPLGPHLFTPEALQKAMDDAAKDLKPDAKGAVVGTVDASGAKVALILQNQNGWQVQFAAAHDWVSGDNQAGAKVIKSW